MPKSGIKCSKISEYLAILENSTLCTNRARTKSFEHLKSIFDEDDGSLTASDVQKILTAFVKCMQDDINFPYTATALTALSSLLTNVKVIASIPVQDLVPSALVLLDVLRLCRTNGAEALRMLIFQVLLSYSDGVLSSLVNNHCSKFLNICISSPESSLSLEKYVFLHKLLLKLPPEPKKHFLKEGVAAWFGDIIPGIMNLALKKLEDNIIILECLEALVEDLVDIDYSRCPQWQTNTLAYITDTEKFPLIIKNLLNKGSCVWHRFWIVFVKILKNQITENIGPQGTPINSMLPVVEMAFKMDVANRCRAFKCWDSLIDNFSKERKENYQPKRIKLLMIPLKLNNVKAEETALAKFHTWWNLIRKFQFILHKFTNEILLAFIHFAFGKAASENRPPVIGAGQIYASVRHLCLQAFAEIVGHENCDCSKDVLKLNGKILNNKLLASYWTDWMYALKSAIQMTFLIYRKQNSDTNPTQVLCVWRAFIVTVAELPPNGVRRDMFNGLIQVLVDLIENNDSMHSIVPDILFSLTLSFFEDNENIRNALLSTKGEELPMHKILTVIINPEMNTFYKRHNTKQMVEMLKPLTDLTMQSDTTDWLLHNLSPSESSLKIWTALMHSMKESQIENHCLKPLGRLLLWLVEAMHQVSVEKDVAIEWYMMYNLHMRKFGNSELDNYILECITTQEEKNNTIFFKLCLTICLLKTKLNNHEDVGDLTVLLQNLMSEMTDYKEYEKAIPMLVDTIVLLFPYAAETENESLANVAVNCVKHLLIITFAEMKTRESNVGDSLEANIIVMLKNIFQALNLLFNNVLFSDTISNFIEVLRELTINLNKGSSLFEFIMAKLSLQLLNCTIDSVKSKIDDSIETLKGKQNNINCNSSTSNTAFTSPDIKKAVKRSKKKEASIVHTVVENGEEYVVVNSNWKFNPRKLTENQKEKFQRKRTDNDIPALYQDLSQSQDEFKLKSWTTDSQDTTSSNSKSSKLTTNEDAAGILKNIRSSDVVPNIMESMLSESDKNLSIVPNASDAGKAVCDLETEKPNKMDCLTTPKNIKSPRIALKDRVFRNERNLIEKSSSKVDTSEKDVGECQIENILKTLIVVKPENDASLISSAPPLLTADRPSRVKRKPKKYDDVQLIALKRRRKSLTLRSDSLVPQNLQNEDDIVARNENEKDNLDTSQNTEANKSSDCNIIIINQTIVRDSDTVEIKENEPLQYLPQSEVNAVLQTHDTKNDLNEQIGEKVPNTQKNYDDREIDKNVFTQYDVKDENVEKASALISVELNSKTKSHNMNETVNELEISKTPVKKIKETTQKSTTKKSATKQSRIEKKLAIDMVEGHPLFEKELATDIVEGHQLLNVQFEKRSTRKQATELKTIIKRKSVTEKFNKNKTNNCSKKDKNSKEKESSSQDSTVATVNETQDRSSSLESAFTNEDAPCSEDVIESSQDSTFTPISVKSSKRTTKRTPIVIIEKIEDLSELKDTETQGSRQELDCEMLSVANKPFCQDTKDDIELTQNKTAEVDKNQSELTENMDTEPVIENKITDDVIIIDDSEQSPITVINEMNVGPETQELAEADTQPNNFADFVEFESNETSKNLLISSNLMDATKNTSINKGINTSAVLDNEEDVMEVITKSSESLCSPLKDDAQRKKDFLNNTSEISPIKLQSPDKDKTPEVIDETSSDYLVVKLSSPVMSNGEPLNKSGSPEFFTEDKISPDKRDQSPPRADVSTKSGSPSSILSLKKNRPQAMRPGGRAAHMLGLCVPDSMNTIINSERIELEEAKKINTSTPARRNLRVLYNTVSDNGDGTGDNEEYDNFLKFKKSLPSTESSPSVPILKRKHIDIVDDTYTPSPASKRKRVSFHDPPVSTTVSVQKYIEPGCIKSPSSAYKRLERQMRSLTKSPKRLENAFVNLDTMLSKAVESFTEEQADSLTNDTNTSLDVTPAVEVVNTSELNDTEPLCLDLVDCMDLIENIAAELSSPVMKELLIKELEGKVSTVGELAKMTELEVNRLCIKAPKIQVAKKVLTDYATKRAIDAKEIIVPEIIVPVNDTALATEMSEEMTEIETNSVCVETQTNVVALSDIAIQTRTEIVDSTQTLASTQTNSVGVVHSCVQTIESGSKTTFDVISSCLSEREDFIDNLREHLEEISIRKISERLSPDTIIDILANKCNDFNIKLIINKMMDQQNQNMPKDMRNGMELSVLRDILCERFDSRDLILFCSQLLQKVYDKPA